jgi:hypothetical protein
MFTVQANLMMQDVMIAHAPHMAAVMMVPPTHHEDEELKRAIEESKKEVPNTENMSYE